MKTKPKNIKTGVIALIGLVIVAAFVWVFVVKFEGEKPVVEVQLRSAALGISQTLTVSSVDAKSGLRNIQVDLTQDGKEHLLLQRDFPGSGFIGGGEVESESFQILVEPKSIGIAEGQATLRITAKDFSWRGGFRGNKTVIEKPVTIDTRPPSISVLTRFHNIAQGGTGLAIYRINESCPESGVYIGDRFFPGYSGYFKDPQLWMAFFALGYDQDAQTRMYVHAADNAGNQSVSGIPKYVIRKRFKQDVLNISDHFLATKMPEFENEIPSTAGSSPIETFLKVNRDLRKSDYEKIVGLVANPERLLYWKGTFLRLQNSEQQAGYADHRDYRYEGKTIDNQVHLGIDLASLARSPVPAANDGKISFTGALGIYGNTVLLDHGFGIFSMYSHLSEINVEKGKQVAKGDIIGRTGTTGMAGGDHLHFSILIHHTFVNPIEWWDGSWIENNVMTKIRDGVPGG